MEQFKSFLKANRGMATRIANELGKRPSTISMWKSVPAEHVRRVEAVTGIPAEQLRPDIFEIVESPSSAKPVQS